MAAGADQSENIRKYEEIGTHPAANHNAIAAALAFHRSIGVERKAARLRYLRNRWAKPLWPPARASRSGRRSTTTTRPAGSPWSTSRVSTAASSAPSVGQVRNPRGRDRGHKDFQGIRVTPNVYTTLEEIDTFGEAMQRAATKGIS